MIAALFVAERGPYSGLAGIDPYPASRDARLYSGPWKVIAHPPCERWGRYWPGGPSVKVRKKLGDDGGCFKSALHSVRTFGGVIEHPEGSHAFKYFGLPIPDFFGGWSDPDLYGGSSCCVAQGHYGHSARKMTWLYSVRCELSELTWGPSKNSAILDQSFRTAEERKRYVRRGVCERISRRERLLTPIPFRDLLIQMVRGAA